MKQFFNGVMSIVVGWTKSRTRPWVLLTASLPSTTNQKALCSFSKEVHKIL